MTVNRLENAADTLRSIATNAENQDVKALLAIADEIDHVRKELPPFVDFARAILSKYTPRSRA